MENKTCLKLAWRGLKQLAFCLTNQALSFWSDFFKVVIHYDHYLKANCITYCLVDEFKNSTTTFSPSILSTLHPIIKLLWFEQSLTIQFHISCLEAVLTMTSHDMQNSMSRSRIRPDKKWCLSWHSNNRITYMHVFIKILANMTFSDAHPICLVDFKNSLIKISIL